MPVCYVHGTTASFDFICAPIGFYMQRLGRVSMTTPRNERFHFAFDATQASGIPRFFPAFVRPGP
jgi:hypothetical protein